MPAAPATSLHIFPNNPKLPAKSKFTSTIHLCSLLHQLLTQLTAIHRYLSSLLLKLSFLTLIELYATLILSITTLSRYAPRVEKHLRESTCEVLNSNNLDPEYKKLFDVLVKAVIKEFYSEKEKKDMIVKRFQEKSRS